MSGDRNRYWEKYLTILGSDIKFQNLAEIPYLALWTPCEAKALLTRLKKTKIWSNVKWFYIHGLEGKMETNTFIISLWPKKIKSNPTMCMTKGEIQWPIQNTVFFFLIFATKKLFHLFSHQFSFLQRIC